MFGRGRVGGGGGGGVGGVGLTVNIIRSVV